MVSQFRGWPDQAYALLRQLSEVSSPEIREKYREERETLVRQPMIALLSDVAEADPKYADFSVTGFAKDPWWWLHPQIMNGLNCCAIGQWTRAALSHPVIRWRRPPR